MNQHLQTILNFIQLAKRLQAKKNPVLVFSIQLPITN
jgi:hypothetical protein